MKVLYENQYIQIRLNSPHKCIEYQWKKQTPPEEVKISMLKVSNYINKHGCNKLLPDLRNQNKLPEDIRLWAESEWFPMLVKQGVRIYAVVRPSSASSGSLPSKISKDKFGITTRYFDDLLQARSWISKL